MINRNAKLSFMSVNKQHNKHNKPYPPSNQTADPLMFDIENYSNKKRTRTLSHRESGSGTNFLVGLAGLEPTTSRV